MKYGSLTKDEVVIDFEDELDIIDFPDEKDTNEDTDKDGENKIIDTTPTTAEAKNNLLPLVSTHMAGADIDNDTLRYTHYNTRSCNRNHKPLVMTICSNIELTVPQMAFLFICAIFLEYFVLLIITQQ